MDALTLIISTVITLFAFYLIIYFAIKKAISDTLEPNMISQLNVLKLMAKKSGIEIETIQQVTKISDKGIQRTPNQLKDLDNKSLNYIIENCEQYSEITIVMIIEEMKVRDITFSESQIKTLKMFIRNSPLLNEREFTNIK